MKEVNEEKISKKDMINKLQIENAELQDKLLRVGAEMQNFMKRSEIEKTNLMKYDGEEFIKSLLPIIDDLERAIKLDDDNLDDELSKFLEGFKLIYANWLNVLNSYEVKEINCLGKEFDPNFMNAVLTDNIIEEEAGIVLDVLQKGYMYKDKLLRPAMVKVNE